MPDKRNLFGKETVIFCCCTYIQMGNYDSSLCFSELKKTQKQWQTVPWSFWYIECLILLVTAKTEPLLSNRRIMTKKTLFSLHLKPQKNSEREEKPIIIIIITERNSYLAHRRCEIWTKIQSNSWNNHLSPKKKQNNRLCTKCKVMGEICLLLSVCLLPCWLVVCLQTD